MRPAAEQPSLAKTRHVRRIANFVLRQAVRFEKLPYKVEAIEAYWDAGPDRWSVVLAAVVLGYSESHNQYDEVVFARLQCKDDPTRDTVHPCEEAAEAGEIGRALADTLNVPFFFASPVEPDDAVPRWWDAEGTEDRAAAPPLTVEAAYPFADMWPHARIGDDTPAWRWRWTVHVAYWVRDTGLPFIDAARQTLPPQTRAALDASFEHADYTAQPSAESARSLGCFTHYYDVIDCVDTLSARLAYAGASVPIGLHYGPHI